MGPKETSQPLSPLTGPGLYQVQKAEEEKEKKKEGPEKEKLQDFYRKAQGTLT